VPRNPDLLRGLGRAETESGLWETGLQHLRQAEQLDPRSVNNILAIGDILLRLRRPVESRQALDRALALSPSNLITIEYLAMTYLSEGSLENARAFVARAGKGVEPAALVPYFAQYQDLGWVLEPVQLEILKRLTQSDFDDNAAAWAICQAQARYFAGDAAGTREYAENARAAFEEQMRVTPNDPQLHEFRGLALAYLGRKEEAIREGEWAVSAQSIEKDAANGPYHMHQLARIEIVTGENEKAIGHLETLLKRPYFVSPAWLKIDPNFDPLRKNPRFQKLVASAK